MTQLPGINVIAPVVPFSTTDPYPSHEAAYGKGGLRAVQSLADRDAIPALRREAGMIVYVIAQHAYYGLGDDLVTWAPLAIGSPGLAGIAGVSIADLQPGDVLRYDGEWRNYPEQELTLNGGNW